MAQHLRAPESRIGRRPQRIDTTAEKLAQTILRSNPPGRRQERLNPTFLDGPGCRGVKCRRDGPGRASQHDRQEQAGHLSQVRVAPDRTDTLWSAHDVGGVAEGTGREDRGAGRLHADGCVVAMRRVPRGVRLGKPPLAGQGRQGAAGLKDWTRDWLTIISGAR